MRRALWMSSGVIVWAVHFAAVYGFTGLACARGMAAIVPWGVGAATLVALAVAALLVWRGVGRHGEFENGMATGLAAFALLAIAFEGVPLFMGNPCVSR